MQPEWPWGKMEKERPCPVPKSQGKGKAKGKKGSSGSGSSGKGKGKGKNHEGEAEQEKATKTKTKVPFLLTNLVGTGNQMGNASSWRIVQNALKQTITKNLVIQPLSSIPPDGKARMSLNRSLLIMLGKLPPEVATSGNLTSGMPSKTMCDSASELLQSLCYVHIFLHFCLFFQIVDCDCFSA